MSMISLPEPLLTWATHQAAHSGLAGAEEYIAYMLQQDQQGKDPGFLLRQTMANSDATAVTPEALEQRREEIELLLLAGLASGPATPFTSTDWERLRQRVQARLTTPGVE